MNPQPEKAGHPSSDKPARLRRTLRARLSRAGRDAPSLIAPGIYDAYGARMVQHAGFEAVYMTGNGVSASLLGRPDAGSPHVVSVTRACLDSLWHCETSTALLATASALRAKATSVDSLLAMVDEFDVRTAGRRRVRSLVEGFA